MNALPFLRRLALTVAVAAVVAGCVMPDESNAPTDLNRDKDRNGIPDDEERALANESSENETTMPGVIPTG